MPARPPAPKARTAAEQEIRAARRRRLVRRLAAGVAGGLLLLGIGVWWKVRQVPAEVWETGSPGAIAEAMRGTRPPPETLDLQEGIPEEDRARLVPPSGLTTHAERWVHTVNQGFPGTILWWDLDAQGNLYVVPGAWLEVLPDDEARVLAMKQLAHTWRSFVLDLLGEWPSSRTEALPGIVFLDRRGVAARDLGGTFTLYHMPHSAPPTGQ